MKSYYEVVNFLASQAPSVELYPSKVIAWAEPLCDLLTFIYDEDYNQVTVDLLEAVKEAQDYEDEE